MSAMQAMAVACISENPDAMEQCELHTDAVNVLTSTTSVIISGGKDASIRVWSKETRRLVYPPLVQGHHSITALVASEADALIFSGDAKGNVTVWDLMTGEMLQNIAQVHTEAVLGISYGGSRLVTASRDRSLKVWKGLPQEDRGRYSFQLQNTLEGHEGAVTAVRVTSDGNKAVSTSGDRVVKRWNLDTGDEDLTFNGLASGASKFQLMKQGDGILAACSDGTIRIYDLQNEVEEMCLEDHTNVVSAVWTQPDSSDDFSKTIIVSASYDGTVRQWAKPDRGPGDFRNIRTFSFQDEVADGKKVNPNYCGRVYDMVVDEKESRIYACGEAKEIVLWEM